MRRTAWAEIIWSSFRISVSSENENSPPFDFRSWAIAPHVEMAHQNEYRWQNVRLGITWSWLSCFTSIYNWTIITIIHWKKITWDSRYYIQTNIFVNQRNMCTCRQTINIIFSTEYLERQLQTCVNSFAYRLVRIYHCRKSRDSLQ